ncbi:unnamed protein product [Ectocarpus sp. 6 AP-2014]
MVPRKEPAQEPDGTMPLPPAADVERPDHPPVNVDDLRRSGKIAIWPYVMRDLPLSPVEAFRSELQSTSRNEASSPSALTAGTRRGVEYFPSCLTDEGAARQVEQEQGPSTDSDLGGLKAKLLGAGDEPPIVARTGHSAGAPAKQATKSNALPNGPDGSGRHLPSNRLRRPSTGGPSRRPPVAPLVEAVSSLPHRGTWDRIECPSGCGEELRATDLRHHQASLCALRYVSCLMPGCSALVQARQLRLHLRRDCLKRKEQRILAKKGKALDDEIACKACNERFPRKQMRMHLATDCQMRMVQCPNCTEMMQARSLADHQRLDCKTAKQKGALYEQAASRPTEIECGACHGTVVTTQLRRHTSDECPSRVVACPNKSLGCGEELPASDVAYHLRKQCAVSITREDRAAKHLFRRQRVQCSGCGYWVVLQDLPRHHREKCPNRRVPCKHWELGCPAMLRLSAMDDHLKVDRLLDPRACLAFDGGRAYITLGESDRKPPWTAEMWVWRPGLVEGTREKTRTALKALWEFHQARGKLAITERRLALLEPLLVDVATRAAKERSEEAAKTRDKLTDEMIAAATVRDDAKVDLVVSVVVLSNSVASATRGVEELTAQDRLRGFDRLALGSTPWYAASPAPSRAGFDRDGGIRGVNQSLGAGKTVVKSKEVIGEENMPLGTAADSPKSPTGLGTAPTQDETAVEPEEEIGAESIPPGTAAGSPKSPTGLSMTPTQDDGQPSVQAANSIPLDHDDVVAGSGGALGNDGDDIDSMLLSISKEQQAFEASEEAKLHKNEAGFWAEWIALTGPSLARRVLALEAETLPRLKEEAVVITGIANKALFDTRGDATAEVMEEEVPDEEGGAQAHESSTSPKQGGKRRKAAKKAKRKQKHEKHYGKSIETRIAEEVGRRGGVETLLGSDKVLFQLEMGPKERIGIKIAGQKDQIFNYRCPRERWVHLAFVSDSTGVFLMEDGKTASRLRDITVPLPMREIGGRETACQCLLQEVRYWKVKRRKEDVVEWMHQVLPGTAKDDGLIGYWTFEEGVGEHVNDVTEQRFRARMIGRGLKWAFSENMNTVEVAPPPTPSWREQNVCKVELRRGRLAQRGRLHRQVVSHLDEDCVAHRAWMRMAEAGQELQDSCTCPHCGETVRRSQLKLHFQYQCHWFKEQCRNAGCGAWVPRLRRAEHERRFCGDSSAVRRRRRLARARARSTYQRDWAQDEE